MKDLRKLIVTGMAVAGLFTVGCDAASEDNNEDNNTTPATTCSFDDDCSEGEVCETGAGVCVEVCSSTADCASGTCLADPGTTGGNPYCGTAANCTEAVSPNAFCDAANAGDTCDATAMACVTPVVQNYRYVQVVDQSTEADSCEDAMSATQSDPGSDFFRVTLRDANGDVLTNGAYVNGTFMEGTGAGADMNMNDFKLIDQVAGLDGSQADLSGFDSDTFCPVDPNASGNRFRVDTVVSVGCGGSFIVEFRDEADAIIDLQEGFQVEVGEFGTYCSQDDINGPTGSDRYGVELCQTENDAVATDADCSFVLGTGLAGTSTVNVTIPTAN